MAPISTTISRLLSAVYPRLCEVCGNTLVDGEQVMCLKCLSELPRTRSHREPEPRIVRRLARVWPLRRAASWFHYDPGGPYGALIKAAKYDDRPSLARHLGEIFARELLADGFFDDIDLIVPLPLHRRRMLRRGYNQSRMIALGIARATSLPVDDTLYARRNHASQTGFNAEQRLANVLGVFAMRTPDALANKHILLVDDIITSGATLESAIRTITADPSRLPAAISVLSLGLTREHTR